MPHRTMRTARRVHDALLVAFWFACNIGVLLLNKALLSSFGFGCPVFLTALHMAACTLMSTTAVRGLHLVPHEPLHSARQRRKVAALSAVFCASVVAGNASLRFIPVSFNQAVSAADPAFTALFAALLQRSRESRATYAALVPIVAGTALASGFEPSFHAVGFALCLSAAGARALKSVLQELLLSDGCARVTLLHTLLQLLTQQPRHARSEKMHSLNLLAHMAPMACGMLLPLILLLERDAPAQALALASSQRAFLPLLLLNCSVASAVNLANFLVTRATSALTLQVLGKAKSVLAVAVSLLLFRNPVSAPGLAGYGICLLGVVAYGRTKSAARAGGDAGGGGLHARAPSGVPPLSLDAEAVLPTAAHARRGVKQPL